jgi:lysozyme family protein
MADFEQAFKKTLAFEGGYANDPDDHGGKTMYGITEAVARANGYKGTMQSLSLGMAKRIYKVDYWDPNQLDKLPQVLAENVFDCGVNCGVWTAAKMLQVVVGVKADGIIGPITLVAMEDKLQAAGERFLVSAYLEVREDRYYDICRTNPSQKKFLKGWINRCKKLRKDAGIVA